MAIDIVGLAVDAGLCVLVWIVQLVIYPGFAFYSREGLELWHAKYTRRITVIVFPLMTAQLILGGLALRSSLAGNALLSFVLILATWILTFVQFVPLHSRLISSPDQQLVIGELVSKNWMRTLLWSVIFMLSVWDITSA